MIGLIAGLIVLGVRSGSDGGERPAAPISPRVDKTVRDLSPAQKVDAVMLVGFAGATLPAIGATQGGVVVAAANWSGAGRGLLSGIHSSARGKRAIPPLVVGLQEGGAYRAYPELPPEQREIEVGDYDDPALAQSWGRDTAAALKKAGFDLNLAPVADVATLDSPIADRAFSDDAEVAARMTAAAVRGCRESGLACAVSHFPGAGAESQSTDAGPATVSLDQESLERRDLMPFEAAFAEKVPAVVVSNAFFAAFDPITPAALSPEIVTDLLRDELGFEGLAITDDLSEGAIRGGEGAPESAVRALSAGADMIQVTDPTEAAATRKALLEAIRGGAVSSERLDEAVGRVLELKHELGLL